MQSRTLFGSLRAQRSILCGTDEMQVLSVRPRHGRTCTDTETIRSLLQWWGVEFRETSGRNLPIVRLPQRCLQRTSGNGFRCRFLVAHCCDAHWCGHTGADCGWIGGQAQAAR